MSDDPTKDVVRTLVFDCGWPEDDVTQFLQDLEDHGFTVASDPCLVKRQQDEPYFVLLGRDMTADLTVQDWIGHVLDEHGSWPMSISAHLSQKLFAALALSGSMKAWPNRKIPD